MRVAATRLLGRKPVNTIGDSNLYRSLEDPRRIRLFLTTDKIFRDLSLGLVLIDIQQCGQVLDLIDSNRPSTALAVRNSGASGASSSAGSNSSVSRHNEVVMKDISVSMVALLRKNDSVLHPKSAATFDHLPPDFINSTLPEEASITGLLDRAGWPPSPERAEEADQLIQQAVIWADDYRSVMLLLCPLEPLEGSKKPWRQARALPLLGAAIGLTATPGETEIRWMFSKLGTLGFSPERLDELESLFALRTVGEALFLEDLRVLRLAHQGRIHRSSRDLRFVSVVVRNLLNFPVRAVGGLFSHLPAWRRHFNLCEPPNAEEDGWLDLQIAHTGQCGCQKKIVAFLNRSKQSGVTHAATGIALWPVLAQNKDSDDANMEITSTVAGRNDEFSDSNGDKAGGPRDEMGDCTRPTGEASNLPGRIRPPNPKSRSNTLLPVRRVVPGPKPQGYWRPPLRPANSLARGPDVVPFDEEAVSAGTTTTVPPDSARTVSVYLGDGAAQKRRPLPSIACAVWSFYGLSLREFDGALDQLFGTAVDDTPCRRALREAQPSAELKQQMQTSVLAPKAWNEN